jgi:hypothetical protein
MTAIFMPEGQLFRATEQAGGPWSPDMLQGSATTALMLREVERLATASGFAVRRLTFDLWRPACARLALRPRCCATAARPRRCKCG